MGTEPAKDACTHNACIYVRKESGKSILMLSAHGINNTESFQRSRNLKTYQTFQTPTRRFKLKKNSKLSTILSNVLLNLI